MKKYIMSLVAASILLFGYSGTSLAAANTYKVKNGDSLYKIARTYKVSVQNIKSWNGLKNDTIHPNQVLKITKSVAVKTASKASAKKPAVAKTITVSASAFTASCKGCSGITSTGLNLKKNPNLKVLSVDPKVIPLGSKVYVPGYGYAVAADKGSAIKGKRIDLFMASKKDALKWGRKTVKVQILK